MGIMVRIKKSKKLIAMLVLISIILVCCKSTAPANKDTKSTSSSSLVPDNTDVTIAQTHWTGTTLSDLTQGYSIFSDKCVQCHETKMPQDFSVSDWNDILPGMGRKARLDSNQYKLVYHYILAKREDILASKK